MALTPSTQKLPIGTPAPDFSLPDVATGSARSLAEFGSSPALLVIFLCAHCPYVVHVAPELARLSQDYTPDTLTIVGITSNDVVQYPADAPEPTAKFAAENGWRFPVLYDETQAVAQAYGAACTPDFFLFDAQRQLAYRGRLDESRPRRGPDRPGAGELNGADLRAAISQVLLGQPVSGQQMPSLGCSIKWKSERDL